MSEKRNAWSKRAILTVGLMVLGATTAFAGRNKLSHELRAKDSSEQVDVIVQYSQVPTAAHHKKVSNRGGVLKRDLGQFRGGAYSIPASSLADLASDPDV